MDRTDILLVLLANTNIIGNTRLQKLPFLIEHEKKIIPDDGNFSYEANRFGPASKSLYDDMEFLINIGFVEKTGEKNNITQVDINDIENMKASDFLTEDGSIKPDKDIIEEDEVQSKDPFTENNNEEIIYKLTDKGREHIEENNLLKDKNSKKIQEVANEHANKSLFQLLHYVYTKFPEYTTESEIRNDII